MTVLFFRTRAIQDRHPGQSVAKRARPFCNAAASGLGLFGIAAYPGLGAALRRDFGQSRPVLSQA